MRRVNVKIINKVDASAPNTVITDATTGEVIPGVIYMQITIDAKTGRILGDMYRPTPIEVVDMDINADIKEYGD